MNPDDRFIAYVVDAGPLTFDQIDELVGGSAATAQRILDWVRGNSGLARSRYQMPTHHADGTIEVRSIGDWRASYLADLGLAGHPAEQNGPPPSDVLAQFLAATRTELESTADEMFRFIWSPGVGSWARTVFYAGSLWPRIVWRWERPITLAPEFFAPPIDHALLDPATGRAVILIESENDPATIVQNELPNLCHRPAPLKVIATCMEWRGHPNLPESVTAGAANQASFIPTWQRFIQERDAQGPSSGIYCFIVAEGYPERDLTPPREVRFRFNAFAFDASGEQLPAEACPPVLHERCLPFRNPPGSYFLTALELV